VGIFLNPVTMANPAIAEIVGDSTSHSSVSWKHKKEPQKGKEFDGN
jgi:hypothetical protein